MNAEDLGSSRIHTCSVTSVQFFIERQHEAIFSCGVCFADLRTLPH